jgi:hypothetical protein
MDSHEACWPQSLIVEDELLGELRSTNATIQSLLENLTGHNQNRNQLIQTSTFGGFATGICISACVATLFLTVAAAIFESRSYMKLELEIEQLKAWNDVTRNNIAKLQAQEKH